VQSNNHTATRSVCFPVTEVQPLIVGRRVVSNIDRSHSIAVSAAMPC